MTNSCHSLTKKTTRPVMQRNARKLSAEGQPLRCFIVVVCGYQFNRLATDDAGWQGRRGVDSDDFIVENRTNVKIFKKFMKKCCN